MTTATRAQAFFSRARSATCRSRLARRQFPATPAGDQGFELKDDRLPSNALRTGVFSDWSCEVAKGRAVPAAA